MSMHECIHAQALPTVPHSQKLVAILQDVQSQININELYTCCLDVLHNFALGSCQHVAILTAGSNVD